MKHSLLSYFVVTVLASIAIGTLAAKAKAQGYENSHGVYVSLFGGWSDVLDIHRTKTSDSTDIDINISLDNGWIAGSAIGYQLSQHVRTEFEFAYHDSSIVDLSGSTVADIGNRFGEAKSASFMNNWYLEAAPSLSRARPYLGIGFGVSRDKVNLPAKSTVNASPQELLFDLRFDGGNFSYQGMVGLKFQLSPMIQAYTEYRFFGTDGFELKGASRPVEAHIRSHNILAGVSFSF